MKYTVKQKEYKNGKATWKTINTFTNPAEADEWLTSWIRTNKLIGSDFTIVTK